MLIKNQPRIVLIAVVIFCLIAMYGFVPLLGGYIKLVKADSLESAKDILSDSNLSASSSHTVVFDMSQDLDADDVIQVTFHTSFDNFASVSANCPTNSTASTTSSAETFQVTECVATGVISGASVATTTIYNLTNPSSDSATGYDVTITILDEGVTELEATQMRVYVIDEISVTATVDATLAFTVTGLSSGSTVNGVPTNSDGGAATSTFGTLPTTGSTTLAQRLNVTTNATNGFTVTVQQTDELTSGAGATINSFLDSPNDTGSTTPAVWASPSAALGHTNTYGHMGLTSSDDTLAGGGGDPFANALFAGLNSTDLMEVMYHDGPANGTGNGTGQVDVAYGIEINALQEAGDYTSTITYICTPTY